MAGHRHPAGRDGRPVPECGTPEPGGLVGAPVDLEALAGAVAVRVVALLREPAVQAGASPAPLLWSAARVADVLGMSVDWVREHRHELGVLPATGPRPRLHFDPAAVRAWATARDESVRSGPLDPAPALAPRRGSPSGSRTEAGLIPIRPSRRAA